MENFQIQKNHTLKQQFLQRRPYIQTQSEVFSRFIHLNHFFLLSLFSLSLFSKKIILWKKQHFQKRSQFWFFLFLNFSKYFLFYNLFIFSYIKTYPCVFMWGPLHDTCHLYEKSTPIPWCGPHWVPRYSVSLSISWSPSD